MKKIILQPELLSAMKEKKSTLLVVPIKEVISRWEPIGMGGTCNESVVFSDNNAPGHPMTEVKAPFISGDYVYVQEEWSEDGVDAGKWIYKSDFVENNITPGGIHWHPATMMPKESARFFLYIRECKVGRISDITEHEALLAGMNEIRMGDGESVYQFCKKSEHLFPSPVIAFKAFWDEFIAGNDTSLLFDKAPWAWFFHFDYVSKSEALAFG